LKFEMMSQQTQLQVQRRFIRQLHVEHHRRTPLCTLSVHIAKACSLRAVATCGDQISLNITAKGPGQPSFDLSAGW
jgi:hypothetical protein